MENTVERSRISITERVKAVLETLRQPEVIVDLAAGAAAAFISSKLGGSLEVNALSFLVISNAVGIFRGEMQSGYYGGNDNAGKVKQGGEWYVEGDHRMIIQRFIEAIKTGKAS